MRKRKLFIGGLFLLMPLSLGGCILDSFFNNGTPQKEEEKSETVDPEDEKQGEEGQEEEKDTTDYGKVTFKTIYLYADQYGNFFDEVPIRPTFTK